MIGAGVVRASLAPCVPLGLCSGRESQSIFRDGTSIRQRHNAAQINGWQRILR